VSRAQRLFDLLQLLRRHRHPVSGAALADELGISLRTLYRDIGALQAQGAKIDGEAGLGYLLRPGFLLPPLMFSEEEIEALVLGMRWVGERGDAGLGEAARNALAKVESVLPNELRLIIDSSTLLIGPGEQIGGGDAELALIRQAIRDEHKLDIDYCDRDAMESQRTIWPFALAFFDRARVVVAWCELRQAFRHFRTDRISALTASNMRYPRRRHALLKAWREAQAIPE
jgi:predicted DNA-binding transcriptional regulator YafY